MAKKKFDTNPLDPEFPEKLREAETVALPKNDYRTAEFPPPSVTEEETRRFNQANFDSYQMPPAFYQNTPPVNFNESNSRRVGRIGLPENILTALPYLPFYIGLISGVLILLFVPKNEAKARFHAAQGLAAHLAILIVTSILSGAGHITGFANLGNGIFQIVTLIMLIVWAIKAWQGKPVHIESIDPLTEWVEEKINPRV